MRRDARLRTSRIVMSLLAGVAALLVASADGRAQAERTVRVYCSLDQEFSEQILDEFQRRTGIVVEKKFDSEMDKTLGMVEKIISEESNPRCDVYWNNEVAHTLRLKKLGLLEAHVAPNASRIPAGFKDAEGYWTGLAARARVIIYNRNELGEELPKGILDCADPKWKGRVAMARPKYGTTLTHFGALFATWGEDRTKSFIDRLLRNDVEWYVGNAMVMREVGSAVVPFGYTDTDDANVSRVNDRPTDIVIPDQGPDGEGTLLIPNSVMIVKGDKNRTEAKRLINYILSAEVEQRLANGRSAQIPLGPGVTVPEGVLDLKTLKVMDVDWEKVADMIDAHGAYLQERFEGTKDAGAKSKTALWVLLGIGLLIFVIVLGQRSARR